MQQNAGVFGCVKPEQAPMLQLRTWDSLPHDVSQIVKNGFVAICQLRIIQVGVQQVLAKKSTKSASVMWTESIDGCFRVFSSDAHPADKARTALEKVLIAAEHTQKTT